MKDNLIFTSLVMVSLAFHLTILTLPLYSSKMRKNPGGETSIMVVSLVSPTPHPKGNLDVIVASGREEKGVKDEYPPSVPSLAKEKKEVLREEETTPETPEGKGEKNSDETKGNKGEAIFGQVSPGVSHDPHFFDINGGENFITLPSAPSIGRGKGKVLGVSVENPSGGGTSDRDTTPSSLSSGEGKGKGDSFSFPRYLSNPPPPYPDSARRRGLSGTVILLTQILSNGKVGEIKVKQSSGFTVLDEAAVKTVKEWQFIPGLAQGKSVDMWVEIPVRFVLQ